MREILCFKTVQCMVRIYDSEQEFVGERLFVIQSHHLKTDRILIRFGTKKQIDNIVRTYKLEKKFSL